MPGSRILLVADASREALDVLSATFRVIPKNAMSLRAILLSFLSVYPERDFATLGPNALFLLMQEEMEIVESIKGRFAAIDCRFEVMTTPDWTKVVEETEERNQDLVILQGAFLRMWKGSPRGSGLCPQAPGKVPGSVLVIHPRKETGRQEEPGMS